MDTFQSMTMRLEAYLLNLAVIQRRWRIWLASTESAARAYDTNHLLKIQADAEQLTLELTEITKRRHEMITDAQQYGWPVHTLRSLAERLPVWNRPRFRSAFEAARNQLAQLQKLHTSTWVFLYQLAQHFQEMTLLLALGTTRQDVYGIDPILTRDGGGQLLDASL